MYYVLLLIIYVVFEMHHVTYYLDGLDSEFPSDKLILLLVSKRNNLMALNLETQTNHDIGQFRHIQSFEKYSVKKISYGLVVSYRTCVVLLDNLSSVHPKELRSICQLNSYLRTPNHFHYLKLM